MVVRVILRDAAQTASLNSSVITEGTAGYDAAAVCCKYSKCCCNSREFIPCVLLSFSPTEAVVALLKSILSSIEALQFPQHP